MTPTKKNHYNPCFWTAHWNPQYLDAALKGDANRGEARRQRVFALNVKSGKIIHSAVENVHYDKGLGIAEITPETAKDFCKRNFPDEHQQFCEDIKAYPGTYYLDFESILGGLEQTEAYTTLIKVIRKRRVDNPLEKAFLAGFILVHQIRSHAILNSMLQFHEQQLRLPKFEYFLWLKHFLSNTEQCYEHVMLFAPGQWTFYNLYVDTFPLNDSPILVRPESIMVALSPRMLLEIDRTRQTDECQYTFSNYISEDKLEEFRRRTINNTFREIIFGTKPLLEQWQKTREFVGRHKLMADAKSYNAIVAKHHQADLWKINAYGGCL
jgi:hypothetical protein